MTTYTFVNLKDKNFLFDVPDILYKFRDWDNPNSRKLLFENELYFSSYRKFNDPFDGGIPFQYDPQELTEANIFLKYLTSAKQMHPDLPDTEIHNMCYEQQQQGNYRNDKFQEEFQLRTSDQLAREIGIVCLCKSPEKFLLWSYYAQSHKGFAIGFHKKELYLNTEAGFQHMQYQDNLPMLGLFEDHTSAFTKLICTKSNIWKHEDEYRLIKAHFVNKTISLRPKTIADITCGCNMPHNTKLQIVEHVKKNVSHATVHEMIMSKTKFELIRQRIF
ncbi:DUF2971 domain-containing protein [Chitinophaga sp. SYP-B3965]|uniref:DUF2971 domain-containing protein n=1 Tax=Chitinophaga sp. SYP-B3965 TaxID=2663120 RepID=UPI001299DA4A|nr:DUF2971 domain-containing protein [Chitinophaga sp. SYP-B3965]MRG46131.1 DUF2971 domain-containing protein [Chitinophaga sp. SYP-B3965]